MNRLLVALLAAFDAVVAVTVGIAAVLAPLTVLWVFGFGASADWGALWPAAVQVWQVGHFVPLYIDLPAEYLAATGIPEEAAAFTISLAPLAFAGFTAIFAARSGARAVRAGAWPVGLAGGAVAMLMLSVVLWVSSSTAAAGTVDAAAAIAFPVLVFVLPAATGAFVVAWREGDDKGIVDALHDRVDAVEPWRDAPAAVGRGLGIAVAGYVGIGALIVGVGMIVRGGDVIALFESANVDAVGAITLTIAQLAYIPTLVLWGASFAAGPGFAIGTGTAVSPAGTSLGVIPGIPILGAVPESTSSWMLLLALLVIGVGVVAGWTARNRMLPEPGHVEPVAPRVAVLAGLVVLAAAAAALLAALAAGSFGPGRLAEIGPQSGPVALAVGVEIAIGAGIALLAPATRTETARGGQHVEPRIRRERSVAAPWIDHAPHDAPDTAPSEGTVEPPTAEPAAPPASAHTPADASADETDTQPIDDWLHRDDHRDDHGDDDVTGDKGPRAPR
ncbi:cell division protein PerM [Microbacterium sp. bgisy189]|uniref:cell division protein PerM n=1 Tax=Microbacterium sp. bgisy189 TaxID=3413798 RepID=UPI003EBB3586